MPSLQQNVKYLIIFTVFISCTGAKHARHHTCAFVRPTSNLKGIASWQLAERSYSTDLDTAYEWLADEPERRGKIKWFHPDATDVKDGDDDGTEIKIMPLYPLGAVHIPHSGENHTIINIEPKNVKMATDLVNGKWESNLFCASLRARGSNKFASVGTIMQLLDTEDRSIAGARTWPGNVLPTMNRVVCNCRAVGLVDIVSIEELDYNEDDYLITNVKVHELPRVFETSKPEPIEHQVIDDFQKVRSIYINSESLASNELPKFARNAVQTLPTFSRDDVYDETKFWSLVETWQMLCNTIRQAKRTSLQSIINELSVTIAMQAKGPLELPVKRKNLPPDVQRQLKGIEESAHKDFIELGMEPVLDFQEIISMKSHADRVEKLGQMIKRERLRLEAKESLIKALLDAN